MIDERCRGCRHVVEGNPYRSFYSCEVYLIPAARWLLGNCPMATHVEHKTDGSAQKVRVGQQKGGGKHWSK